MLTIICNCNQEKIVDNGKSIIVYTLSSDPNNPEIDEICKAVAIAESAQSVMGPGFTHTLNHLKCL